MPVMIRIRTGIVVEVVARRAEAWDLLVEVDGSPASAVAYPSLTGPVEIGDRVVLNTTATWLGLGTGGAHFVMAVAAQFLYVAAQTGIFSFCVNYVLENDPGVTRLQASRWLGGIGFVLFMVGRMCGSAVISQFKPHRVLAAYSVVNVALVAVTMGGGKTGMYAMFASFFFMSIGFPTIFALGIRGLGEHTKLGSSLIVMSIVGGAIAAPFMGHIADLHSMRIGFVVPLVCFVFVALYGLTWASLIRQDSSVGTEG